MRFERELNDVVVRFASELAERARRAAHQMVVHALEHAEAVSSERGQQPSANSVPSPDAFRYGLSRAVKDFEREWIVRALDESDGNVTRAAEILRTTRQALQRKVQRFGIRPQRRSK